MARYLGIIDDNGQLLKNDVQYHCIDGIVRLSSSNEELPVLHTDIDVNGWTAELNSILPFIKNSGNILGYSREDGAYFCTTPKATHPLIGTKRECIGQIKADSGLKPPIKLLNMLDTYIQLKMSN